MPVSPVVVVGAAIVGGDEPARVLAAQRSYPADLAGLWELPGGKVHADEDEPAAVVRECREELQVEVAVGARLGPDLPITGGGGVLRVWTARLVSGSPVAVEHASLRWLSAADLDAVPWLPADLPLVPYLRGLLTAPR